MDNVSEIGNADWTALGVVVVMILSFTGIVWRLMNSQSKQSNKLIEAITGTTGATNGNTAALKTGLEDLKKGFIWQGEKIEGIESGVKLVGEKIDTHIDYSKKNHVSKKYAHNTFVEKEHLEAEVKKSIDVYKNNE